MPSKQDVKDYIDQISGTEEQINEAMQEILYTCWFQNHKIQNPVEENLKKDLTKIENSCILPYIIKPGDQNERQS